MRILHYTLGLYPQRSGGLTKYSTDLMLSQIQNGDSVFLLYPQNNILKCFRKKIAKKEIIHGISIFSLKNAAPVPLLYGIRNTDDFIEHQKNKIKKRLLEKFYTNVKPDVFHIHTLMGLSLSLVNFLKGKGVKIVYTSHDYFGLCLKVNFINSVGQLCAKPSGVNCSICNKNSPKSLFLRIRNSNIILKNKGKLVSLERKEKINYKPQGTRTRLCIAGNKKVKKYEELLIYYKRMFAMVDIFHFNSKITETEYKRFLKIKKSVVIPITHQNISDNRRKITINKNMIRLGFIGNTTPYKGLPLLINVLNRLRNNNISNWKLYVWGNDSIYPYENSQVINKGKYQPTQIKRIYKSMDLLIVPSIWKETFSLIVLEAISYGIPVLVTTNVGAKDIVHNYNKEFIVPPSEEAFYSQLLRIFKNPKILEQYNIKIYNKCFDYSIKTHTLNIKKQLYLS